MNTRDFIISQKRRTVTKNADCQQIRSKQKRQTKTEKKSKNKPSWSTSNNKFCCLAFTRTMYGVFQHTHTHTHTHTHKPTHTLSHAHTHTHTHTHTHFLSLSLSHTHTQTHKHSHTHSHTHTHTRIYMAHISWPSPTGEYAQTAPHITAWAREIAAALELGVSCDSHSSGPWI